MPLYPPPTTRTALGLGSGTSFPGSPASGDQFYRTDHKMWFHFDGTRWLSSQVIPLVFGDIRTQGTSLTTYAAIPYSGTFGLWMDRLDTGTFRTLALPDEWDVVLAWLATNGVATTITTIDGSADVHNNWIAKSTEIGSVLDANAKILRLQYLEIDDGSSFAGAATLHCRLIAT